VSFDGDHSEDAVGERLAHRRARVEGAEDFDGADGGAGELGGHVIGDARESHDMDVQRLLVRDVRAELRVLPYLDAWHQQRRQSRIRINPITES